MTDRTDIAQFYCSTEEDLRFRLTFQNRSFTGRTLAINVRERDTNVLKMALTAPSRITVSSSGIAGFPDNDVAVNLPKSFMEGWARGEYEADLLDLTVGSATRVVAVRFTYDFPGNLVYGVVGNQVDITVTEENQAVITAVGGVGLPGPANTLQAGTIEMLPPGSTPEITITGDAPLQTLNLKITTGDKGDKGDTGEIVGVGAETLAPGSPATVTNTGTTTEAVLLFGIPQGDDGLRGWAPELATEEDGARRVHRLIDWIGGEGAKPAETGYLGPTGIVATAAEATDIRGEPGASVGPGSIDTPELADGAVTEIKVDPDFLATILRDTDLAELVPQTSAIGAAIIPSGTTLERPGTPLVGYVRFNETTGEYEGFNGAEWAPLGGGGSIVSDTPPTENLREGMNWFSTTLWAEFIYIVDAGETEGQWISKYPIIDTSAFMLKVDNLAGLASPDTALANLGGNANGVDIFKNASALGATIAKAASAAAARLAIGAPPIPQTAAGTGQLTAFASASGGALILPAGGTWGWWRIPRDVVAGDFGGGFAAGVDAGGTTVSAGVANIIFYGVCWRLS